MPDPIAELVEVPMTDGTVLRAHVARPASSDAAPVPVMLFRTPYLAGLRASALLDPEVDDDRPDVVPWLTVDSYGQRLEDLLAAGFAVAVQACRGTGESDGVFRWMVDEYTDGADTARWFAAQPWCAGVLGGGASYVSATQFATALADPDALVALSPWVAPSDIAEDMGGRGGVRAFAPTVGWAVNRVTDAAAKAGQPAPANLPAASLTALAPKEWAERLATHPQSAHATGWLTDAPGAFDAGTYPADRLRSLDVPAFHVAGWYDVFCGGSLRNYMLMRQGPAREHQHLVIGPWHHADQQGRLPGPVDFGPDATLAGGGIDRLQFDFWRRHGQGADVELPRVRLFVMGENAWRDVADWPVPDAVGVRFALGLGTLSRDGERGGVTTWRHDPGNPVPTTGGQILMGPPTDAGPHDQRPVEARNDVMSFSSPPLSEALVVVGPARARLWVSSDAATVDLHASLTDVAPDGYSRILTDGVLRIEVGDGQPVAVDLELWPTANAFLPGHRLRLNVAASNWPRYVLNPQAQTVTLHHDAEHPSTLEVQVI